MKRLRFLSDSGPQASDNVVVEASFTFSVLTKDLHKWVRPDAIAVSTKEITHTAVLLIVTEVDRDTVRPPVVVEPFGLNKGAKLLRLELHQPTVVATSS